MPGSRPLTSDVLTTTHGGTGQNRGWLLFVFGHLSLRLRLVGLVVAVELIVLAAAGYQMLHNAREAVREEIAASQSLARQFAIAAVGSLLRDNDPDTAIQYLPTILRQPRHVRIHVVDAASGDRLQIPSVPHVNEDAFAPGWFERLIDIPIQSEAIPVQVGRRNYGTIVITTEPRDEIAEVWTDLSELLRLSVLACIALNLLLYVAVSYSLRPLSTITNALEALRAGNYRVRVPRIPTPELAAIGEGCNSLAAGLERALADKDQLNQRLIKLQDTERKNIALELHDEFGPCLFGIKAEADSLVKEATRLPDGQRFVERAESILGIVSMMQISNRELLSRLRPMAIGQLPLAQVIGDMIRGFVTRSRDITWSVTIAPAVGAPDETIEITVYRIAQEAITNAVRHAQAGHIKVSIRCREGRGGAGWIRVRVADDGIGIVGTSGEGVGLHGMRERVESLGGRLRIHSRSAGGTVVTAMVPDQADASEAHKLDNV